jgi:hypothetical protein
MLIRFPCGGGGTLNPAPGPGVGGKTPYCGVPGALGMPPIPAAFPTLSGRGLPTLGVRGPGPSPLEDLALIGGGGDSTPPPLGPNALGGKPSPTPLGVPGCEPIAEPVYGPGEPA